MIQVFSKEWFAQQQIQKRLLWLANTSYGRDLLRIDGRKSRVGKNKILRIDPNAIFYIKEGKLHVEFRSHNKFAKRLHQSLKPLWEAMHWFDENIANPLVPAWNLGFDTFRPDAGDPGTTSCDGYTERSGVNEAWSTIYAGAGTSKNATSNQLRVDIVASTTTDQFALMQRTAILFDTSALSGGEVASGTLQAEGASRTLTFASGEVGLVSSSPASNTTLATTDHPVANWGSTDFSSRIAIGDVLLGSYNDFELNASGISNINTSGVSKFGLRMGPDIDNSAPAWVSSGIMRSRFDSADVSGESSDPILDVTLAGGGSSNLAMLAAAQ